MFIIYSSNWTKLVIVTTILTILVTIPTSQPATASPYSAGYDHGCDDAKISNANDKYINQPDKGPSEHTQ